MKTNNKKTDNEIKKSLSSLRDDYLRAFCVDFQIIQILVS